VPIHTNSVSAFILSCVVALQSSLLLSRRLAEKSLEQCLRLSKSDEDKQCKKVLVRKKGKESGLSRMSA
jgi:hypothetical protein